MAEFFDLKTETSVKCGKREYTFTKERQRFTYSEEPRYTITFRRWDNQEHGIDQRVSFPIEDLDVVLEKIVELRDKPAYDPDKVRAAIKRLEGMLPDELGLQREKANG